MGAGADDGRRRRGLGGNTPPDVQQPLLLVMPVILERVEQLRQTLRALPVEGLNAALDRVGTVHGTRFVIIEDEEARWAKLCVIATFDGSVDDYIAAFARELNDQFNVLFRFVADTPDKPTPPVRDDVETFVQYVKNRNVLPANGRAYSAYPDLTVLDVYEATRPRTAPAPAPGPPPALDLELDDIQGVVLRGYRKAAACHLLLRIDDGGKFRTLLRDLAEEDPVSGPFVTVAADWQTRPPVGEPATRCVNIGFTHDGLAALGLPQDALASFPAEFRQGAVARAERLGDTGPSAPEEWRESLRSGAVHAVVSLYADDVHELEQLVDEVTGRAHAAATAIDRVDAHRLGGTDYEHFGFRDGLSQPTIAGAPLAGRRDPLPPVPPGEFVLGQPTQRDRPWDPVPGPPELGRNGSFAAFRVMAQDVRAFEAFLDVHSERHRIDRELLAAKLCGRWRTGEPLVLRPARDGAPLADDQLNDFDYETTAAFAGGDPDGLRCPRGAHIRRTFPRSQRVIDDFDGTKRRIVRRAMPYGPPFDPAAPDREERGLVGMFICASLREQFEYIMRQWVNDGLFTGGRLGRTRDPLVGANDAADGRFDVPGTPAAEVAGFPRFVRTRGCAYLFLPSMTALRHLASME